jgi:hypothetical protein
VTDYTTHVRLVNGQAEVQTGSNVYTVSRKDIHDDPNSCPVELVVGALGS